MPELICERYSKAGGPTLRTRRRGLLRGAGDGALWQRCPGRIAAVEAFVQCVARDDQVVGVGVLRGQRHAGRAARAAQARPVAVPAPDGALVSLAGLRSKHNTYMSVPLVFAMLSNHSPTVYGNDFGWLILFILVLVGWGVVKLIYTKSASAAPAQY